MLCRCCSEQALNPSSSPYCKPVEIADRVVTHAVLSCEGVKTVNIRLVHCAAGRHSSQHSAPASLVFVCHARLRVSKPVVLLGSSTSL